LERIKETFGDEAITSDGEMNREYIGELVFNHPEKRLELNEIILLFLKLYLHRQF
jgi:dephospho-CoA kinase